MGGHVRCECDFCEGEREDLERLRADEARRQKSLDRYLTIKPGDVDNPRTAALAGTRRCDGCEQNRPTVYSPPHDAHFCESCVEANDVATSEEQN
jgi:hypothetical protein